MGMLERFTHRQDVSSQRGTVEPTAVYDEMPDGRIFWAKIDQNGRITRRWIAAQEVAIVLPPQPSEYDTFESMLDDNNH